MVPPLHRAPTNASRQLPAQGDDNRRPATEPPAMPWSKVWIFAADWRFIRSASSAYGLENARHHPVYIKRIDR